MRITNINTLSSLFDRLVCERIKHFFFNKDGKDDLAHHQELIIDEIKREIEMVFMEENYEYLSEKRTFVNELLINLDELVKNDIHIGESDRRRLEEIQKLDPRIEVMIEQEKRLRTANEGRSKNKNDIDLLFQKVWNQK